MGARGDAVGADREGIGAPPKRLAVYSSSAGDYFFGEIRHLLACGLRAAGADAVEKDERSGWARADAHVIVAPAQFFYLGSGARLRAGPWPDGVVLYNAEQPGSDGLELARRLLPRARAVWDMDLECARRWAREGWPARHVPLGWVPGCRLFEPVPALPRLPFTAGLGRGGPPPGDWEDRPLDLIFGGSRTPRRERFFSRAAGRLARLRSLVRLVDDSRHLKPGPAAPLYTRAWTGLAQRAKVVLNVHRSPTRYFEWHRMVLQGIAQGALVIAEPASPAPPFKAGVHYAAAPLRELPSAIEHYLLSEGGRREGAAIAERAQRGYRRACRLEDILRGALAALRQPRGENRLRLARAEAAAALLSRPL